MKLSDLIKIVSFNVNQGIIRYRREQRFVKKKYIRSEVENNNNSSIYNKRKLLVKKVKVVCVVFFKG